MSCSLCVGRDALARDGERRGLQYGTVREGSVETVAGAWVGAKVVVARGAVTAVVASAQAAMVAEAMEEARVEALAEARVAVATAAKVEVTMELVMVAVVQEAVAAVERVEEAKAMVEVAGVVQEWVAVLGGRTSPGRPSW